MFEYRLAIKSIKKSIELKSKDTLNLNFLASLYITISEYNLAILTLEESLELDAKNKNTLMSMVQAHIDMGNLDEAEKYLLLIIDYEKKNYKVFYYLIKIKKKYLTLDLMNTIKEDLKYITSQEEIIYANLILAESAALKNDFINEIKLLNKSHTLFLKKKEIAAAEEWNYYSNLLPQFVKKCEGVNDLKLNNQISPIFILGMPRSGTTLVENIIASGKEKILIGGETNAFDGIFYQKGIIKDNSSLTLITDFGFKKIDFELLTKDLINHYNQLKLINNKNNIFTDKSITNFFYIDIIKKIFPNAKFIYCSRNPLANVLGILKVFLPHLLWSHSIEKIFKYFDLIMKKLDVECCLNEKNFTIINLEELSSNPKKISKNLFKFLNIEWSEECIKVSHKNIIKTASNIQLRKPIQKHDLNYLKNYYDIFKTIGKRYEWFKH